MPEGFSPASSFVGGGTPAVTPPVASTGFSPASSFVGGGTPTPAAPTAGNPTSFTSAASMIPKASPDAPSAPGYFQSMSPSGTFLGISDQNDISGKPFFAYKAPGQATTTDTTRVATTFDPRVAQVLNPSQIQNGRMPESVSSPIKQALGGQYSDELDHQIALELAGSNAKTNLGIEPGRTNGGQSAQFDTEENALAKLVQQGKMSLWDAQYKLAQDKHNAGNVTAAGTPTPIPFVDKETAAKGMNFPTTAEGDQVIANAGQDGLNASTIKYPFIDKMAAAGPSNNPIVGATKWAAELPEEVFNIGKQFLNAVTGKGAPDVQAGSAYTTNTPQDYFNQMHDSLTNQGVPPGKADWISALYGFSAGVLDLTPVADLVNSGVKALASHAVGNEELIAAHTLLGSPSTVAEADSNFKAAAKIASPDVVQGAGGSAEDIARANETMKALNNAHQIIQTEGIPRSGLMQKAASFAQKLTSPISDLGKTSVSAVAKPPVRAALPAEGGSGVVAPETRVVSVDEPKVGSSITHDGVPQNVTAVKTVAGEKSFTLMDPATGKETSVTAKELQAPTTSRAVQGAAKAPANITPQTTPLPSIGTRSVSEVQADLNMALEHKSWLEDHLAGHPGRGVGKFINHRTGEFLKGGDVAAMQQMGQEESDGGDLDTVLAHGENFKAGEAQLQSVKNEIARYQKEMKTATPDVVKPTETISPSPVDDMPDFPVARDNSVVLSASFPGAGTITKFVEKDVIPVGMRTAAGIRDIYDAGKNLLTPSEALEKGKAIMGAALQKAEQAKAIAWKTAGARRQWWANVPEEAHLDFLDNAERGARTPEGFPSKYPEEIRKTWASLAKQYRERMDIAYANDEKNGVLQGYRENYFQHVWSDPDKAAIVFHKLRARIGVPAFAKLRTIDLMKEGLVAGLKPLTTNPEEIVMQREIDSIRITSKAEIMSQLEKEGLSVAPKDAPAGWVKTPDINGKITSVPADIAKVLDNALFKPDLWSKKGAVPAMFKSWMAIKGTVVPIKLAITSFHPILISIVRAADQMTGAMAALLRGTMTPGESIAEFAKGITFVNQGKQVVDNYNLVKRWDSNPKTWTDTERTAFGYMNDGGFSPKISEEMAIRSRGAFRKALSDENYIGATIRGFPQLIETSMKPIFGVFIPSLRTASYLKSVEQVLRADPTLATDTVRRQIAFRHIMTSVDNRFVQLNYKTRFWNPMVKSGMQASFLSTSMLVGPISEAAGATTDLGKLIYNAAHGEAKMSDVSDRMLFAMNLTGLVALLGGLFTYGMTGKTPKTVSDFFQPLTGDQNPDGTPQRILVPSYLKNYFSTANNIQTSGLLHGTATELSGKINPMLTSLSEIWQNKTFLGTNVYDSTAPMATQTAQLAQYLFNENVLPISFSSAQSQTAISGSKGTALSLLGFNAAPSYTDRTGIQAKIIATLDERTGGAKPLGGQAAKSAKANIKALYYKGDTAGANAALQAAVRAGYIAPKGVTTYIKSLDTPTDVKEFQLLVQYPSDQKNLLSQMTETELARYVPYANNSIKANLSQLSPTAYKFVQDLKAGKVQLDTFYKGQVVNK